MKRPEYIGISGVVNTEQQEALTTLFKQSGLQERGRVLQLGVKATHKPQYLGIENKYGREWYPVGCEIDSALAYDDSDMVTGVAQVCFDDERVNDTHYRRDFLWRSLGNAAHSWLTGVQFDMLPWYPQANCAAATFEHGIYYLEDTAKDLTRTLQCQGDIMIAATPEQIAQQLQTMPYIDYILFDASGGRGLRMDVEMLLPYIDRIYNDAQFDHMQVAVGGGLNAHVVRTELPKILKHFPAVSWDAEGQLHPVNHNGKRPLDMAICKEYLEASAEVLAAIPYNVEYEPRET